MSSLEKKYQELIHCLEKNIKDAKELNIAKEKLADLIVNYSNLVSKGLELENKLERIELNMMSMHERINSIEDDFYLDLDSEDDEEGIDEMHDNDFEFEIVCPYCQHGFITDSSYKNISQIRCPKCNKTIELDWQDEPLECGGHCHSCGGHCGEEEKNEENSTSTIQENDEKYTINVREPEKQENKKEKKKKDDNEDDM